jgi:hypothetical protein
MVFKKPVSDPRQSITFDEAMFQRCSGNALIAVERRGEVLVWNEIGSIGGRYSQMRRQTLLALAYSATEAKAHIGSVGGQLFETTSHYYENG